MDDITNLKRTMIAEALSKADDIDKDPMAKAQTREAVSLEEALQTEMLVNQALIDLLIVKGIITQDELLRRVKELKKR